VDLGAKGRSDEPGNIFVPGKLAEGEHASRIGRLVILYDKLDLSAKHATCLVYLLDNELGTLNPVKAGFGQRSRDRSYHADFERLCGAPETGEHGQDTG
jgi:hypothetical protein